MLWATHRRIAQEVIRQLGTCPSSAEMSKLLEGVIAPDVLHETSAVHAYPHHYGKSLIIRQYVLAAREAFLQGDTLNAYYDLGVALHYIQDAHTSYPSFLPKHKEWEGWIESSYIVPEQNIEATIHESIKDRRMWDQCSSLAKQLSAEVVGRDATLAIAVLNDQRKEQGTIASPKVDLYLGFRGSYLVSKSVLGPKYSLALNVELAKNLSQHEEQLRAAEVDLANKIVRSIGMRDALVGKKVPMDGIVARIKNWITNVRLEYREGSLRSDLDRYSAGGHLDAVSMNYSTRAANIADRYGGWYCYAVPPLNPSIVPKEILELGAASAMLGLEERQLIDRLREKDTTISVVGSRNIIRRADLDVMLGQCPINGMSRCPYQYREPSAIPQTNGPQIHEGCSV